MPGFVDEAQVHVKAGDGGAGSVSFRREAHVAKGGPDGGDGGNGGDVWLVATGDRASLLAFKDHPHRRAGDGRHGQGKQRHGARGEDLEVPVPAGTIVRAPDGSILVDLVEAGHRWMAARGGRGGRGNARFLSNRRRAPAFAEQGEPGGECWYNLELKLLADVALVGFPNAGKSTLISRVSAARPKIGDYPFTTLVPNLGVVRLGSPGNETEFVLADVPGLVEGASEGRGLGHRFLRHVERARVIVVLVDLGPSAERHPSGQVAVLMEELRRYQPELVDRPRLVVGSKADLAGGGGGDPGFHPDLVISAVTGEGIPMLIGKMARLVVDARAVGRVEPMNTVIHRPIAEEVEITRNDDGSFVVGGRPALRAVALNDLTDSQATEYVQDRLRRLGVERMLVRAGARDGDVVHLGQLTFTYHRDQQGLGVPDVASREVLGMQGGTSRAASRRLTRRERSGKTGTGGAAGGAAGVPSRDGPGRGSTR